MNLNSTDTKTIRKFGLVALVFFGCLSALGLWKEKPLPFYLFGLLSAIGLGLFLAPKPLRPVYVGWLKTAHFLGRVVTTLILTLDYYLVITPSALIKRLFGGAPLPVKPDKESSSYWVTRAEPAQPKERYIKRY
ncbi:MAG: SxtJ family membrane protein [Candidatus Methanospirareceae archaeon]